MRTDFLLVSAIILSSSYGLSPPVKRQGLFSCSGWGASCMSGWNTWRRQGQKNSQNPKTQYLVPAQHKVVGRPRNSVAKFWLTTEKTWGPMGKRSNPYTDSMPLILYALLENYITKENGQHDIEQLHNFLNLPSLKEEPFEDNLDIMET